VAETYQCSMCDRDVPWSDGAADNEPELCDGCWAKKVAGRLDTDASAHHARGMAKATKVRLRVTTKELGVREVEWHGRFAEQTAKFYTSLWEREGHKVERF
jgi:hypothetical protein